MPVIRQPREGKFTATLNERYDGTVYVTVHHINYAGDERSTVFGIVTPDFAAARMIAEGVLSRARLGLGVEVIK